MADFDERAWHAAVHAAVHERDRLLAVQRTALLDTGPEEAFDRLTRLAATTLGVPWAFVTLVDDRRSFWKSCFGVESDDPAERQNAVQESFCQYVVALGDTLLIDDARLDRRTRHNPSIESMGVLAWAGCPLRGPNGEVLGTFCAVSTEARHWSERDEQLLATLAGAATSELQLRVALADATEFSQRLESQLLAQQRFDVRGEHLAELARQLASAYTAAQVSRAVANIAPSVLAASFVNIHLVDPSRTTLTVVRSPGLPQAILDRYRTLPLDRSTAAGTAVLEQRSVYAGSFAEYARIWPTVADDAAAVGLGAAASWPLVHSDGTVMGALSIGWPNELELSPLLESALATLTQMCAAALERGRVGDNHRGLINALQLALLPEMPALAGLDVAARYVPANNDLGFGGDWYDVFAVSETLVAIVIGDVCGHGISAAATMALLRGSFNALVRLKVDSLHELFDDAERWFVADDTFVATVAVHVIDLERDEVRYVSAGHPPTLVALADGTRLELRDGRRPVFGVRGAVPVVGVASFPPGALLLCFTDGLFERRGVAWDDGYDELARRLVAWRAEPADRIATDLVAAIDWAPDDDVAFVVARREVS